MYRRKILTGIGIIGITAVAGCSSSDNGSTESGGPRNSRFGQEENGEDEGRIPDERIHELGETFTVGEGDRVIEYTINDVLTGEQISGGIINVEADGVFHVVTLSLTNRSGKSFTISSDNHAIVAGDDNNVYAPAGAEARAALSNNQEFDIEPLSSEQLNPDLPILCALIYDVPEGLELFFVIAPDDSELHAVRLE